MSRSPSPSRPPPTRRRPQRCSRAQRGDPRWRQLAGARLPGRRRHAALHAARRRALPLRRRRQALRRLHRLLGPDDPRPRPPGVLAAVTGGRDGFSFGAPERARGRARRGDRRPVEPVEQVRLVNSGTEATMCAIRLARGFTGRDVIVKFAGCYHGHVDALLVSAGSGVATFGLPDSAGVPRSSAGETIVAALQRRRRRSRPPSPSAGTRSPRSSSRPRPATWASSPRSPASPRACCASPRRTARCSSSTR